jgi:ubiquinone/menaquinone biosynthesis C-methylase UbiE
MMKLVIVDDFAIQDGCRILDLGCQSGRMIRWLASSAEQCEIWGVDVSARHITWCQENLSPPFSFATVTTQPHLPFGDKYFDLVICGSVFTHIDDLSDAWLLEIKRVMCQEGRAYITVSDNHTLDLIINHIDRVPYARDFRKLLLSYDKYLHFIQSDWDKFCILTGSPGAHVFYDIDYLRQHWGRILHMASVTQEAYGYQTAVVLKR